MKLLNAIKRPEYFWRPQQIWRRLNRTRIAREKQVMLAWGLPIEINPNCHTGVDILNLGLYDRIVPEMILRFLNPGELAVDVGANIGQNSSVMALATGPQGRVVAFEPHPPIGDVLQRNIDRWSKYSLAPIKLIRKGLSAEPGTATLFEPGEFGSNMGAASLEDPGDATGEIEIELTTLDQGFAGQEIGVMKLDVEGHELSVLQGATKLLQRQAIREIIFEDFQSQPSPVTLLLESFGYEVRLLTAGWRRPRLYPATVEAEERRGFYSFNFLATCDPERFRRVQQAGWNCLRQTVRI